MSGIDFHVPQLFTVRNHKAVSFRCPLRCHFIRNKLYRLPCILAIAENRRSNNSFRNTDRLCCIRSVHIRIYGKNLIVCTGRYRHIRNQSLFIKSRLIEISILRSGITHRGIAIGGMGKGVGVPVVRIHRNVLNTLSRLVLRLFMDFVNLVMVYFQIFGSSENRTAVFC